MYREVKLLLLALTSTTPVYSGVLKVTSFHVSGDCSPDNTQGVLTEEDDCNIIFSDMTVSSSGKRTSKSCHFEASVQVPDGYQIAADSMSLDGEYSVEDTDTSVVGLRTDYQMGNIGKPIMWMSHTGSNRLDLFPTGTTGSFSMAESAKKILYAPCGKDVTFKGNLSINSQGQGSYISLDQSIAKWDWKIRKCNDQSSYPAQWDTYYRAANGQDIHAKINFMDDQGRYTLADGSFGTFSKVNYQKNIIQGYWNFQNKTGWFYFRLLEQQQYFSGSWGYGSIGDNPQGHWSGSALFD